MATAKGHFLGAQAQKYRQTDSIGNVLSEHKDRIHSLGSAMGLPACDSSLKVSRVGLAHPSTIATANSRRRQLAQPWLTHTDRHGRLHEAAELICLRLATRQPVAGQLKPVGRLLSSLDFDGPVHPGSGSHRYGRPPGAIHRPATS